MLLVSFAVSASHIAETTAERLRLSSALTSSDSANASEAYTLSRRCSTTARRFMNRESDETVVRTPNSARTFGRTSSYDAPFSSS